MELELEIGGVEVEVTIAGARGAATLLGVCALAGAIVKELRTPTGERTWHGTLIRVLPYDLRPPTLGRLRALWDPANPHPLVPTAFGVGWTVNLAALAARCGWRPVGASEAVSASDGGPLVPSR